MQELSQQQLVKVHLLTFVKEDSIVRHSPLSKISSHLLQDHIQEEVLLNLLSVKSALTTFSGMNQTPTPTGLILNLATLY